MISLSYLIVNSFQKIRHIVQIQVRNYIKKQQPVPKYRLKKSETYILFKVFPCEIKQTASKHYIRSSS